MPAVGTRLDSLQLFMTGAASDGGANNGGTNPDLPSKCLGGYRCVTRASAMKVLVASGTIAGVRVDYASGANGAGTGTIAVVSTTSIKYKGPGSSTYGATVTFTTGAQMLLEDGENSSKYLLITCVGAPSFSGGPMLLTLSYSFNNSFSQANIGAADAITGLNRYWGLMLKNVTSLQLANIAVWRATLGTQRTSNTTQLGSSGAGTIVTSGSLADWPAEGLAQITKADTTMREIVYYTSITGGNTLVVPAAGRAQFDTTAAAGANTDTIDAVPRILLGWEEPTANAIQTIADLYTEPSSPAITWNYGLSQGTGLTMDLFDASALQGLWVWEQITPGSSADPAFLNKFYIYTDAA